jgi:DNA polymerase-3 subunit alpha
MTSQFVHLHLHSDYSLLDGACSISGIIEMAHEYKMPAVAMTDHGFMGGSIEFYQQLTAEKIKPIIGCEAYVAPTNRFDQDPHNPEIRGHHLVLLAKDDDGYKSLCKLISEAHLNGFYYKPRIDKELLAQYSKGLIALSACIGGEIPSCILKNDIKKSKKILEQYLDIMGRDNFYLELMDHGMKEEQQVNKELILLSKEFEIPLVATNDVHYLKKEHAKAHELMLCIQTHSTINETKRFKFPSDQFYFKNDAEMFELFKEVPEAVTNTLEVAERCNVKFDFEVNHYPVYEVQAGQNQRDMLKQICLDEIKERYGCEPGEEKYQEVVDRMEMELGVIDKSGYCSYFLVVWDFLHYARQERIPVGPGRGSGAGSIVAYLTHITDIDPLRYNLLFERFLNPDRVSPPDFDIDFCERRRSEVIEYVRGKYGNDSVAQIGTYGTLKAKAVLKDVARVLGHSFAEGDKITKLVPTDPKMNLKKAKAESKELRELIENEDWVAEVFKYAEPLEGLNRNMSIHAAGVIIGDQRLDNLVPLARGAGSEIITQFPAVPCENLGLLKMDFLGLRTLTIIQDAIDNIKKSRNIDIDFSKVPLDDTITFKLLNKGDTVAVFQLESSGMQNLCRQFGVETIEHIIALIAIYRPGPMQFIPDFIARKMGGTKIEYDHPKMEQYLNETYGIMLYQEQIMQVVQVLAGFSLGQADILRRAIGKKKVKVLEQQKAKFVKGCAECNQIDEKISNAIWEKIAMFAGYGFNKSHSAAYAFLAYRTAYLKANYPVEFMAAVLTSELSNADKIAFLINECKEMGIPILPPDVNSSNINFTVDNGAIRFGLGAIKGVGGAAASAIIESREKEGVFKDLLNFCERTNGSMNTRMMEHLSRAGAFSSFDLKRSQLVAIIEPMLNMAQSNIKDQESGQGSLFDMLAEEEQVESFSVPIPDIPEFDESEILADEKALLGFYVTGHPLAKYADIIKTYSTVNLLEAAKLAHDQGVKIGGIIKSAQKKLSKKDNNPYAIIQLEDLESTIDCMVYGKTFEEAKEFLEADTPIFIEAMTSQRDPAEKMKLIARKIIPLEAVIETNTNELHLHIYEGTNKNDDIVRIKSICEKNNGNTRIIICVTCASGEIAFVEASEKMNIKVNKSMLDEFHELLGEKRYKLKADKSIDHLKPRFQNGNWNKKEGDSK